MIMNKLFMKFNVKVISFKNLSFILYLIINQDQAITKVNPNYRKSHIQCVQKL